MKTKSVSCVILTCLLFVSSTHAQEKERVEKDLLGEKNLYAVNVGATAIGTGINVPTGYPEKCAAHLARLAGKPIVPASDMLAATWDQQGFVVYSAALQSLAIKLSIIASDLTLLASGPRAGLFEINLPALQPGSSIMPGKVNPVIPEQMNLVAFRVMGNDYSVTLAAHGGQLQLNAYEPLEGLAVLESQALLYSSSSAFRTKCMDGITVKSEDPRAIYGNDGGHCHSAKSDCGLREGDRPCGRSLQERKGNSRDNSEETHSDRTAD